MIPNAKWIHGYCATDWDTWDAMYDGVDHEMHESLQRKIADSLRFDPNANDIGLGLEGCKYQRHEYMQADVGGIQGILRQRNRGKTKQHSDEGGEFHEETAATVNLTDGSFDWWDIFAGESFEEAIKREIKKRGGNEPA